MKPFFWFDLRCMIGETLLWLAIKALPPKSEERREALALVTAYMKRRLYRRTMC